MDDSAAPINDQLPDNSPSQPEEGTSSGSRKASSRSSKPSQRSEHRGENTGKSSSRPKECWACGDRTMPGKLVCKSCFYTIPTEEGESFQDLPTVIHDIVQQSLREQLPGPSSVAGSVEIEEAASTDCIEAEDGVAVGFDFALVPPFVRSVREAIEWEEEEEPPAKKRYFPHLKKKPISFPVMDEVNELVLDEWSKTDKKAPLLNRMTKLYPLEGNLIPQLETPPTVDAAVMRLAKHVTLPLEDSVSFKDPLDRKMDSELRRAHINIGAVCKPAIALTSVSRAIRAWADNMEGAIQGDVDRKTLLSALEEFRLASDFVGEAAFDIIRSAARGIQNTVTIKRALWLRPWNADPNSKAGWCKIPFDGSNSGIN
ncbi:lamina-associated polypeptide 2-like [Hyperolius riggenbachi]|uniref:lamina-associated polypeptide 2-like n=1 Tax=Hyperolius riggenbachi TaxID=752182 RepID=UPI0035A2A89D